MKPWVIDASVVAAAFFRETHAARAARILTGDRDLLVPDLIFAETANVIWKRYFRKEVSADEARQLLVDLRKLPLAATPSSDLTEAALELALQTQRSVYDCLYLALAVSSGGRMVTADKRLVNALKDTPLAEYIISVENAR